MSEYTRAKVLEIHRLPSSQVGVLLHPPSRAFLSALRKHGGSDARSPRADGAEPRFLFVGRADDPRKNLSLLFDACRILKTDGFRCRVSIVGPHTPRWAESQVLPPNVDLLGPVDLDRLVKLYLASDALVLSSRQEGFGIVVAEAMHAGLPVIATPCGGPEDVLRRSRGGLIAGFRPGELSITMREMVANHEAWQQASRNAAQFADTELSFGRMTESLNRILTDVIGKSQQPSLSALAPTAAL